jgi:hypothetical protein
MHTVHLHLLVIYSVPTDDAMTSESQQYNCFIRYAGNAIPKHACPEAKVSNSITGLTLQHVNIMPCNKLPRLIKKLHSKRQKKPGKTSEGTSGCVATERANKWFKSMITIRG